MVPPLADQVTPVFVVPLTVAVNCFCVPACSEIEVGLIETLILPRRDQFDDAKKAVDILAGDDKRADVFESGSAKTDSGTTLMPAFLRLTSEMDSVIEGMVTVDGEETALELSTA